MYGLSRSLYYHLTFFFFDIRAENDKQNVRNKGKADSVTRHTKSKTFCNNMQNDFLNLSLQSHFQTQRQLNYVQVLLKQSRIENNLHVNVWNFNTSLHRPGKGHKLVCLPRCHVSITTHQSWSVI